MIPKQAVTLLSSSNVTATGPKVLSYHPTSFLSTLALPRVHQPYGNHDLCMGVKEKAPGKQADSRHRARERIHKALNTAAELKQKCQGNRVFQLISLPVDKSLKRRGEVWSPRIVAEGGLGCGWTLSQAWSLRSWVPICKALNSHFLS